jgi:V8-like Glu-specific endopeptidase
MENDDAEIGVGTGILISPDLVLTAAHNLYQWKEGRIYDNFRFYLGQSGPLGMYYQVKSWHFPDEFTETNAPAHDYALLRLAEKTYIKEFIDLKGDLSSVDQVHEICIFGYSRRELVNLDPRNKYFMELHQWGMTREKNKIESINREKG